MPRKTIKNNHIKKIDSGFQRSNDEDRFKFTEFLNTESGQEMIRQFLLSETVDTSEPLPKEEDDDKPKDPTHSLIPEFVLDRLQTLLERGAELYGQDNWRQGSPSSRSFNALGRHFLKALLGDSVEDHLACILFNTMLIMYNELMLVNGYSYPTINESGEVVESDDVERKFVEFADVGAVKNNVSDESTG